MTPALEFVARLEVQVAPPITVGEGPMGLRRVIAIRDRRPRP